MIRPSLLLHCLGGGWCAYMYACFRSKGFAHRELMRATDERLLAAGARELQKQSQGGEMAGWRFERARVCTYSQLVIGARDRAYTYV